VKRNHRTDETLRYKLVKHDVLHGESIVYLLDRLECKLIAITLQAWMNHKSKYRTEELDNA